MCEERIQESRFKYSRIEKIAIEIKLSDNFSILEHSNRFATPSIYL